MYALFNQYFCSLPNILVRYNIPRIILYNNISHFQKRFLEKDSLNDANKAPPMPVGLGLPLAKRTWPNFVSCGCVQRDHLGKSFSRGVDMCRVAVFLVIIDINGMQVLQFSALFLVIIKINGVLVFQFSSWLVTLLQLTDVWYPCYSFLHFPVSLIFKMVKKQKRKKKNHVC